MTKMHGKTNLSVLPLSKITFFSSSIPSHEYTSEFSILPRVTFLCILILEAFVLLNVTQCDKFVVLLLRK